MKHNQTDLDFCKNYKYYYITSKSKHPIFEEKSFDKKSFNNPRYKNIILLRSKHYSLKKDDKTCNLLFHKYNKTCTYHYIMDKFLYGEFIY